MSEAKVLLWYPTAMLNCPCQEGRVSLIVVTGFNNYSKCGNCGKLFHITDIAANPEGLPIAVVGTVLPTPSKEVM